MEIIDPHRFSTGVTPSPTWNGFGNKSRSFDGTDQYISIPKISTYDFGTGTADKAFSISAWVKIYNADRFRILADWHDLGPAGTNFIFTTASNRQLIFYLRDDSNSATLGRSYSLDMSTLENEWLHVVGTYDGTGGSAAHTGVKLYINNVRVDNAFLSNNSYVAMEQHTGNLSIGSAETGAGRDYSQGKIADLRIFEKELSTTDISSLYGGNDFRTDLIGQFLTDVDDVDDYSSTANNAENFGSVFNPDNPSPAIEFGGASRSFDGLTKYMSIADNTDIPLTNQTWSCWVKLDRLTGGALGQGVISQWGGTDNCQILFILNTPVARPRVLISGDGTNVVTVTANASLNTHDWYHLAWTFDPSTSLKLYINGVLNATETNNIPASLHNSSKELRFARRDDTFADWYDGNIADVRVYNSTLSATDIANLYGGSDIQTNLVGWWLQDNDSMEDKAGTNDATNFGSNFSFQRPFPANKIIDTYASTCGAYSLRELSNSWAGQNVIDVRRNSDNQISGFTAAEITNGTLAAFCGSLGGFVSKIYDQSGNGFHLEQATTANQPKIYTGSTSTVHTNNGKPCITFSTGNYLSNSNSFDYEGGVSWYGVHDLDSIGGTQRIWSDDIVGVQGYVSFPVTGYQVNDGTGYVNISVSGSTTAQELRSFNFYERNGVYSYGINGSKNSGTLGTFGTSIETSGSANIGLFASGDGQQTAAGDWQELIIYPNDQSRNKENIERDINDYYSIY